MELTVLFFSVVKFIKSPFHSIGTCWKNAVVRYLMGNVFLLCLIFCYTLDIKLNVPWKKILKMLLYVILKATFTVIPRFPYLCILGIHELRLKAYITYPVSLLYPVPSPK